MVTPEPESKSAVVSMPAILQFTEYKDVSSTMYIYNYLGREQSQQNLYSMTEDHRH